MGSKNTAFKITLLLLALAYIVGINEEPAGGRVTAVTDTPADYIDIVAPHTDVLKALKLSEGVYLLTDLGGVAYVVNADLIEGVNYIVYLGLEYELMAYVETGLNVEHEDWFLNPVWVADEIERYASQYGGTVYSEAGL